MELILAVLNLMAAVLAYTAALVTLVAAITGVLITRPRCRDGEEKR